MTDLQLEATSRTPAVTLDPVAGKLVIAGESYPEDITAFYAQLTAATGAVA
ncbi:MAG TPA: Fe-S oxidoreductase, partial [Alphaproteobacteria bacterium]|nr:Fe-S oxidoreductase [Alphaproteobacteria bacterium]